MRDDEQWWRYEIWSGSRLMSVASTKKDGRPSPFDWVSPILPIEEWGYRASITSVRIYMLSESRW